MTREELDERILNRIPHSGSHHYDGIFFLTGLLASRRRKNRERSGKLNYSSEHQQSVLKVGTPKEVIELKTIEM